MKIWIISDSHGKQALLDIPDKIDMVIHAGDFGTARSPVMNEPVVREFLSWYKSLTHIKYKVLIAGNHDTSIEAGLIKKSDIPESIIYLEHEYKEVAGLKIFGSPYTPSFGDGWAFNVPRNRLEEYWKDIPENLDFLITHGPPKGILDLTVKNGYDQCGCKSLLNRVKEVKPRFHVFGHIHNESDAMNAGIFKPTGLDTTFINAAVLNLNYEICNNGVIIEI